MQMHRHALHGLDADLIMLSLATHEPHFTILREYVGPAQKKSAESLAEKIESEITKKAEAEAEGRHGPGEAALSGVSGSKDAAPTPFQFLHIATLREYLYREFEKSCDWSRVSEANGFEFERVIDDFIFLCFFVGNDFLPHLPSLDIRLGAIDTLIDLYKTSLPQMGGFICDGGRVHLGRCKAFTVELGKMEDELLRRKRADEERDRDRKKKRLEDVRGKALEARHKQMMQRVAEAANIPKAAPHLMAMRTTKETQQAEARARQAAAQAVLGRDAALLELFEMIKGFSELPDDAAGQKLPSNLNSYLRAMTHQYCEECSVTTESRGSEPNREMWLVKKGDQANESAAAKFKRELDSLVKQRNTFEQEEDTIKLGVDGWKDRYYGNKFSSLDEDGLKSVAASYVEGLCWVMRYYYEGCCSWGWFFPYHYAPFAADIAEAVDPDAPFEPEIGQPFAPFEQLMGVLPPRSAKALPASLAEVMCDPASELAECAGPRALDPTPTVAMARHMGHGAALDPTPTVAMARHMGPWCMGPWCHMGPWYMGPWGHGAWHGMWHMAHGSMGHGMTHNT